MGVIFWFWSLSFSIIVIVIIGLGVLEMIIISSERKGSLFGDVPVCV